MWEGERGGVMCMCMWQGVRGKGEVWIECGVCDCVFIGVKCDDDCACD